MSRKLEKHYTLKKAAELIGVTTQTLRNWDNAGKIQTIRTPGNQRRIPESEIVRLTDFAISDSATAKHEPLRSTTEIKETGEKTPEKVEAIIDDTIEQPSVIIKSKENYLLMCKDTPIYDIIKDLVLNESLLPGCLLNKSKSYSQWMETRRSKDTNFSSQRLMQRAFGSFDNEHVNYTTGAFSLSDCYWLKRQDEDIPFMDVTPYIHKEWDGMEESGVQNDYIWGPLSNLFVSGKTDKRWIDSHTLLKVNSFREIEPYNLCSAMGLEHITEVQLTDEGIILSNFTSPEFFFESMEQSGISEDTDAPRNIAIEKYKELAVALFVIDYLVENNDRQIDDYGYLRSSATGEYVSMAPYHNFDWVWSGDSVALPEAAWLGYRSYIHDLCLAAIGVAKDFEYGMIIERRAGELLRV